MGHQDVMLILDVIRLAQKMYNELILKGASASLFFDGTCMD
jgi:hypothetical protein